ncbi:MAG: tetratricopeptide repeat protein, partial [Anaerolineae bacterium]|nr:tetratricopeptide repeat protein [Anaerolineae bacterium]
PLAYAMTQNNLGTAYLRLPTGDRSDNLQRAIACYQEALRVYTPEAAPLAYAMTQNNLGEAYIKLPSGKRTQNIKHATALYQDALRFFSVEQEPLYYSWSQRNLGTAFLHLSVVESTAHLEKALDHIQQALQVEGLGSWERAEYLFVRGIVYLVMGELEKALIDYREAISLANAIVLTEAIEELDRVGKERSDIPGLQDIRALLVKAQEASNPPMD